MSEQSKAIELADWIKNSDRSDTDYGFSRQLSEIEEELRRLDAENADLLARLGRRMADIGEFANRYTVLVASHRNIAAQNAALLAILKTALPHIVGMGIKEQIEQKINELEQGK